MPPSESLRPRRILIYGVTGSGKTTLAARLSAAAGLPWHSVDDLTWDPGWMEVPAQTQRERISAICALDEWILDTAYAKWLDIPLSSADLVVALDYPRWISLQRLSRRTIARILDRRLICNGNRESLWTLLSKDSIILWHFRSFHRKRQRIREWARTLTQPTVCVLRSPREAHVLINRFARQ